MSDEKTEKKGIVSFDEGMKNFNPIFREGKLIHPRLLAVDILIDDKNIGYICDTGRIGIQGHVIEKEPTTIMSYSDNFTLEQWLDIGIKATQFKVKCAEREIKFAPAFKKLKDLAGKMFPEDGWFNHIEIAKVGRQHVLVAGGRGQYETYAPGLYVYENTELIPNIGYRSVSEQAITAAVCMDDEMLAELIKAAGSIDAMEG